MSNASFIKAIAPDAQKIYRNYNILASLVIAQGCLESGYGNSGLATKGKNLFGVKGSYKGSSIRMLTWEVYNGRNVQVYADFRKYPSWYESMQDLANLYINGTSWDPNHYKAVVGEKNYRRATNALVKAGYATDPAYATKLNNIISTYNLTKYDTKTTSDTSTGVDTPAKPAPEPTVVDVVKSVNVDAFSPDMIFGRSSAIPRSDANFRIQYMNGRIIDMARDLSVLVHSLVVSSPNPSIYYETIPGKAGSYRTGKDFGNRKITAQCTMYAADAADYYLLRDEIYNALYRDEEFYLIAEGNPKKRWKVEVSDSFDPERSGSVGEFSITFESASPYCESVGTTQSEFTFDSSLWQFGERLTDEIPKYKHTTKSFRIYNAGAIRIDPLQLPFVISYKGASSKLKITNKTTGDMWQYDGDTAANETVILDGVKVRKNGVSIFGETNRRVISLEPGWNTFTISGPSGAFEIAFDFRFYYF
ncbi:glucosaminidase domain-containing protein [Bacillus pumilus]|uniref:glucosaminidase domain-containing protein n=1 Tax=Bacillus pumilus TaxID=1408 RepID=UPI00119DBFEA|nr:glucosaminidase domain-containing protein [Bacillus pumilus]